ncbi:hypothetical protein GJ496_004190 [Pomphorhynchus laevis]|nr:hypothetical protein GJ496_004190 [Pomphorhynchus laevis]
MGNSQSDFEKQCPCSSKNSTCPMTAMQVIDSSNSSNEQITYESLFPLSKDRVISSIPRSDNDENCDNKFSNWVYPSEHMFYNAMRRKGWKFRESSCDKLDQPDTDAENDVPVLDKKTMESIILLHNINNERTWLEIKNWEAWRGCMEPKLKRFHGSPDKLSPRARFRKFLGYSVPFDRHDWYVDACGKEAVRYVIDYYESTNVCSNTNKPEDYCSSEIDARPAVDRFSSLLLRLSVAFARIRDTISPIDKSRT